MNRLKDASSPYLLQHADNPVDWYEWGPEAFLTAQEADKPIFLSIGYAACHWCHVMAHESFEDPDTAAVMNEHFINIKLDREERPDIDSIYMDAVVAMTGHGGWPMSVFLTPTGEPFYGGTYFPPVSRHQLPAFRDVLESIARAWREDRSQMESLGNQLTERLQSTISLSVPSSSAGELDGATLDRAAERALESYDWQFGGWGGAPKFPQSTLIEFLLRRYRRNGDGLARDMALHALDHMAAGGIYDQVGGGFHRYAVDAHWLVPHFEKMLYDNVLLIRTYTIAWLLTQRDRYRRVAEQTIDFLLREMSHPEGGLFSSLDADSEGHEGKFYVWTPAEIEQALEDPVLVKLALERYGATERGNFEGTNVLHLNPDRLDEAERSDDLRLIAAKLLKAREDRIRPALDDKVLASWNGLGLSALSGAAQAFSNDTYLEAAQRLAEFMLRSLLVDGALKRTWREGRARYDAFLEDHAAIGLGMLDLYAVDFNPRWYGAAVDRAEEILAAFRDSAGGFFDTREDQEALILRPKSIQDTPIPSGNSLAISLLLRLAALTGDDRYDKPAQAALLSMQGHMARHPTAFSGWLSNLDFALGPQTQLALVGDPADPSFAGLSSVLHEAYYPNLVVAGGRIDEDPQPALLEGRALLEDRPTAYLCEQFSCQMPTNDPKALREQLARTT